MAKRVTSRQSEKGSTRYTPQQEQVRAGIRQKFARALKKEIDDRGWSQSETARAAKIPRDAVSTYVNAKVLPNRKHLVALARAFRVAPEYLLSDRDIIVYETGDPKADATSIPAAYIPTTSVLSMQELPDGVNSRVYVDKIVPNEIASEVYGLLSRALANSK